MPDQILIGVVTKLRVSEERPKMGAELMCVSLVLLLLAVGRPG